LVDGWVFDFEGLVVFAQHLDHVCNMHERGGLVDVPSFWIFDAMLKNLPVHFSELVVVSNIFCRLIFVVCKHSHRLLISRWIRVAPKMHEVSHLGVDLVLLRL